jgi:hypothetical protein
MILPKSQAVELVRRVYGNERALVADRTLPDPVDVERDAELLRSLGMTRSQIYDRLGASP